MKKTAFIASLVLLTVIGLSIVQVAVANMISTKGIELAKMEQEINEYKRQNAIMKEQILEKSSFTEVASKAGELGFIPSKNSIHLSSPLPLAKR
jgi:cell division protein FtsL